MEPSERNSSEQIIPLQRSIPIKWIIPDSISTQHATNLLIQQKGTEFILLFFEIQQPLLIGTPEEQIEAYNKIEDVGATCIARIVVSIENLEEMLKSLTESIDLFHRIINSVNK